MLLLNSVMVSKFSYFPLLIGLFWSKIVNNEIKEHEILQLNVDQSNKKSAIEAGQVHHKLSKRNKHKHANERKLDIFKIIKWANLVWSASTYLNDNVAVSVIESSEKRYEQLEWELKWLSKQ